MDLHVVFKITDFSLSAYNRYGTDISCSEIPSQK